MILTVARILPSRLVSLIFFAAAVMLFVCLDSSVAMETLRIEAILASPNSYAQHNVTLRGKVKEIRRAEPYPCSKTRCGPATLAFDFILEDETGTIGISVPCSCFAEPSLYDGQEILAIVSIRIIERDGVQPVAVGVAHQVLPSAP